MGEAREGQWGETEVGDYDGGGPAAVEKHEVDDIGVGPFVVEGCDFWFLLEPAIHGWVGRRATYHMLLDRWWLGIAQPGRFAEGSPRTAS